MKSIHCFDRSIVLFIHRWGFLICSSSSVSSYSDFGVGCSRVVRELCRSENGLHSSRCWWSADCLRSRNSLLKIEWIVKLLLMLIYCRKTFLPILLRDGDFGAASVAHIYSSLKIYIYNTICITFIKITSQTMKCTARERTWKHRNSRWENQTLKKKFNFW